MLHLFKSTCVFFTYFSNQFKIHFQKKLKKEKSSFTIALKGHRSLPWFLVKCSLYLTQFLEVSSNSRTFLDSSWKSQTVLGSFKQFSEVLNSSQNILRVLRSFKQFLEGSNNSRKLQMVFKSLKQLSDVSNSSSQSQTVLASLKSSCTFYHLVLLPVAFVNCCQTGLQSCFLLIKIQCVAQNLHYARMAQDRC